MLWIFGLSSLTIVNQAFAEPDALHQIMDISVSKQTSKPIQTSAASDGTWAAKWNNTVLKLIDYIIDIFIVIAVVVSFIWAYQMMTSSKEDTAKKWIGYIVYWIIGVVIMVSAKFIAWSLINIDDSYLFKWLEWVEYAKAIYDTILYPFIKIVLYLVVWVLFFFMAAKVVTFIFSTDDKAKKKAWWIIARSAIWILIVMWAKQIVESVMGKEELIFQKTEAEYSERWNHLLDFDSIPIVTQIINWVLWLSMLVVLILIIVQGYSLIAKPDDPKWRERIKKTILYMVLWVLVIWATSIIANVLILK